MGHSGAVVAVASAQVPVSGRRGVARPGGATHGHPVGIPAAGVGVRVRHDLLAIVAGLERSRGPVAAARGPAELNAASRLDWSRCLTRSRPSADELAGPAASPTRASPTRATITTSTTTRPAIARRGTQHGTGLGTYRWVVERTFAWLHGFRRLRSDGNEEPTSTQRFSNSPAASSPTENSAHLLAVVTRVRE